MTLFSLPRVKRQRLQVPRGGGRYWFWLISNRVLQLRQSYVWVCVETVPSLRLYPPDFI